MNCTPTLTLSISSNAGTSPTPSGNTPISTLYLYAKEELDQTSGLSKVQNVDMLRQIEKSNEEVRQLSLHRLQERRRLTVAIAVSAVVFILLLTFVYLFLNLKRNHKLLFQKNRELLEREEQLKMLMAHGPSAGESVQGAPKDGSDETGADCEADEESALLFPRILKVMEEDRTIYDQGFGADDLAALLHVPQRSVSRAINACSGMNFHQFLNGYRVREAYRLMQDTDPETTTVEYIAESVGFKSRTSFASLFKKTTGLTPSEYWRMTRKKQ